VRQVAFAGKVRRHVATGGGRMFRKLLGKDDDSLSMAEEAAITRLVAARRNLVAEGGRVNTKSEVGFNACSQFLDCVDAAAKALRLDPVPRSYRLAFTINYRALFPDEARNYRVDVLEASVEQYAVIWVNGDTFEFTAEAMRRAEALQRAWAELGALIDRHVPPPTLPQTARPTRSEWRNALVALDCSWASFEHKYIAELIAIEEQARRLVVQAIEHERAMQMLEAKHHDDAVLHSMPEYRQELGKLVGCIAHLNSVANFRRKGRDDLKVEVLFDAMATLRRCEVAQRSGECGVAALYEAAQTLARDVVESFLAIREYLREVERCLERIDPHLCNNLGLVARLVDWEESWEIGTRYVQHEALLACICDLVAEVRSVQRLVPALANMCEDCDVELFMVLPRIIWLRFLSQPMRYAGLVKMILPHRFKSLEEAADSSVVVCDSDLKELLDRFTVAKALLCETWACGADSKELRRPSSYRPLCDKEDAPVQAALDFLMRRAIIGPTCCQPKGETSRVLTGEAQAVVDDFVRELERWSMELQRHCPEDWNQCSAILVQCLSGPPTPKRAPGPFRV